MRRNGPDENVRNGLFGFFVLTMPPRLGDNASRLTVKEHSMRSRILRPLPITFVLFTLIAFSQARADDNATSKNEFLKFVDDGKGGGKLETAIDTYRNDTGATVHLVAAVHIADQSYYDGLNKTFKGYDALLYEMVKPKDADPPQPGEERSNSMISVIQRFMKDTLDLKFQLDAIDYTAPNFVHADLDAETFQKMEEDRGESIWTLMLQQMLKQMMNPPENQPEIGMGDLLQALTSPDRARQLKLLLGRQFSDIETQMSGFGGTVLLTERNKACFKVLDQQLADGKHNVGIFYGAGHMTEMEKMLLKRGFHKTAAEWRVAWDMSDDAKSDNANTDKPKTNKNKKGDAEKDSNGILKIEYVNQK
jgi:hypothetical protein